MNTLIVGAGAIGCMLAARLAATGAHPILVARPHTAPRLAAQGIILQDANGSEQRVHVPVVASLAEARKQAGECDLIVLAIKSFHTATTAHELQSWPGDIPILCLQNGVGNEETLAASLPGAPIIAGVLSTPVAVLGPGHVQIGRPSYWLGLAPGPHAGSLANVSERFAAAGFRIQTWPQYQALKWSKLLMNMLANAQSAILGWTPAQIFAHPLSARIEILAWREAIRTMRALSISPLAFAGYPLGVATKLALYLPPGIMRLLMQRFIIKGRGSKMPSLYYDIYPQPRRRSEVAWLNGAVADHAAQLGLPAPCNRTLYHVMQSLLQGDDTPAAWQGRPDRLWHSITSS